jgi:hypothetical protein
MPSNASILEEKRPRTSLPESADQEGKSSVIFSEWLWVLLWEFSDAHKPRIHAWLTSPRRSLLHGPGDPQDRGWSNPTAAGTIQRALSQVLAILVRGFSFGYSSGMPSMLAAAVTEGQTVLGDLHSCLASRPRWLKWPNYPDDLLTIPQQECRQRNVFQFWGTRLRVRP